MNTLHPEIAAFNDLPCAGCKCHRDDCVPSLFIPYGKTKAVMYTLCPSCYPRRHNSKFLQRIEQEMLFAADLSEAKGHA